MAEGGGAGEARGSRADTLEQTQLPWLSVIVLFQDGADGTIFWCLRPLSVIGTHDI